MTRSSVLAPTPGAPYIPPDAPRASAHPATPFFRLSPLRAIVRTYRRDQSFHMPLPRQLGFLFPFPGGTPSLGFSSPRSFGSAVSSRYSLVSLSPLPTRRSLQLPTTLNRKSVTYPDRTTPIVSNRSASRAPGQLKNRTPYPGARAQGKHEFLPAIPPSDTASPRPHQSPSRSSLRPTPAPRQPLSRYRPTETGSTHPLILRSIMRQHKHHAPPSTFRASGLCPGFRPTL
jgi:hypothetical protein